MYFTPHISPGDQFHISVTGTWIIMDQFPNFVQTIGILVYSVFVRHLGRFFSKCFYCPLCNNAVFMSSALRYVIIFGLGWNWIKSAQILFLVWIPVLVFDLHFLLHYRKSFYIYVTFAFFSNRHSFLNLITTL